MITDRDLIDVGLSLFPKASAIVLAGSYLRRSRSLVADVDIIVLDEGAHHSVVAEYNVPKLGTEINVTAYNELHFLAIAQSEDLVFYWLREIRKFVFGRILFETDDLATRTTSRLRQCQVSKCRLVELFEPLKQTRRAAMPPFVFDIEFTANLETLYFLKMHTRVDTLYSKHKYLLEDARRLPSPTFAALLETIGRLYHHERLLLLTEEFEELLQAAFPEIGLQVLKFVADARKLLAQDLKDDAVFPLRYGALRALALRYPEFFASKGRMLASNQINAHEQQLIQISKQVLLLGNAVEKDILDLFEACLAELEDELSHLTPSMGKASSELRV